MVCPRCKNKDFIKSEEVTKPLKNIGHKELFDTVDYRRYVCLMCGYVYRTYEKFDREVKVRTNQTEISL